MTDTGEYALIFEMMAKRKLYTAGAEVVQPRIVDAGPPANPEGKAELSDTRRRRSSRRTATLSQLVVQLEPDNQITGDEEI